MRREKKENMDYTKETVVVSNPSENVLRTLKHLQNRKREQLKRLRGMKPEEFSCRIFV